MINKKCLLIFLILSYLVTYSFIRVNGLVYNKIYYVNYYQTNSKIILIYSVPGCITENIIYYTGTYGWQGIRIAFTNLNLNYSKFHYENNGNDILWLKIN